ncbi:MFS transporter [Actinoalloteichus sp. AHMU CJ021]|uniref:MFS transporter n=1 Tax=Actinoalloteichus sp. AHMU CJ021 TaxID=2072503 RepID=UPI00307B448A
MRSDNSGQRSSNSLWRNRNFMLLWVGQSIGDIGSAVTQLALPMVAVLVLNASTLEVGLLSAMTTLPNLLVSLHAGSLVDRLPKRKMMLFCHIGRFVLLASIPITTIPGLGLRLTYSHLLVVALLTGVLTVFFMIAYQSYLPILLSSDELLDGNGKVGATQSFAYSAGPAIAGALVGLVGVVRAIAINVASFGVSAVSLFLIRKEEPPIEPRPAGHKMRHDIFEGLRFVVKHPVLRKVVACTGTSNFFSAMGFAVEMVFLLRILNVAPALVGLIFSVSAVGGVVGGILAGRLSKRVGNARIIWFSILVLGFPSLLMPLAQPGFGVLLYAVGLFFFMTMAVMYNVAQVTYRQVITPPALLGRMNASVRFIVVGTSPLGAALGGVLGTAIGVRPTLWIAFAGAWLAGLWVFFSPLRKMRDFDDNRDDAEQSA